MNAGHQTTNKCAKNVINSNAPICRWWNVGKCTMEACQYKHICSKCHSWHQSKDCTSTTAAHDLKWLCLNWTWGYIWSSYNLSLTPSATGTEMAPPFVDVPMMELHNVTALKTIAAWPDLSKLSWLSGLKDSMNSYLHTLIIFSLTLSATALGKGYGHSWTLTHQHQKIFLCHHVS